MSTTKFCDVDDRFNWVLDRLAVGSLASLAYADDFVAVVTCISKEEMDQLLDGEPLISPTKGKWLYLPIADGVAGLEQYIDRAVDFIHTNIIAGEVLVHCAAGRSRSVSVIIAYLVSCGFSCQDAKTLVASRRMNICPAPVFIDEIKKHFGIER